jgi:hypothetical protein
MRCLEKLINKVSCIFIKSTTEYTIIWRPIRMLNVVIFCLPLFQKCVILFWLLIWCLVRYMYLFSFYWKHYIYIASATTFITHRIKSFSDNVTTTSRFIISLCIFLFVSISFWPRTRKRIWKLSKSKFWEVCICFNSFIFKLYMLNSKIVSRW